jgi:hypothetical protein
MAVMLAAFGTGLLLWAIYNSLTPVLGPVLSALFTGMTGLISAGLTLWIANLTSR